MGLIRFILACGVVLCHTSSIFGYSPLSSDLAVQVFYIISGFYMAMILTEKYTGINSNYLFYTNRALKIYPVYLINLVLLIAISLIMYKMHYPSTIDFYLKYAHPSFLSMVFFIIVNLIIIGLDLLFLLRIDKSGNLKFTPDFNKQKPNVYNFAFNSIAWTVGVELLFYVIAPWLTRRKMTLLICIMVSSLLLRILMANVYSDAPPWNYMFFPTQLMFFMAGILSYRYYRTIDFDKINKLIIKSIFATLLLVVLFYYNIFQESYLKNIILFVIVSFSIPFVFKLTQKSALDRYLGNISYPIYITQGLVIKFVGAKSFPKIGGSEGLTTLIIDIAISIVLELTIGRTIEKLRNRRIPKKEPILEYNLQ